MKSDPENRDAAAAQTCTATAEVPSALRPHCHRATHDHCHYMNTRPALGQTPLSVSENDSMRGC